MSSTCALAIPAAAATSTPVRSVKELPTCKIEGRRGERMTGIPCGRAVPPNAKNSQALLLLFTKGYVHHYYVRILVEFKRFDVYLVEEMKKEKWRLTSQ
jgi:hypothetical protein